MIEKITYLFSGLHQRVVEGTSSSSLCCKACRNTPASLSSNSFCHTVGSQHNIASACCWNNDLRQAQPLLNLLKQTPRVPAGQGLLPAPPVFSPLSSSWAEFIKLAAEWLNPAFKTYAHLAYSHNQQALQLIDGALTQVINQMMPWQPAAASSSPPISMPTAAPAELQSQAHYLIHHPDDNRTLFSQQIDTFFSQMNWLPDDQLKQQWTARLKPHEVIFIYPEIYPHQRPERAHIDEMKRRTMLHEMAIRDKTLAEGGVGVRIIAWADEHSDKGYTLFKQGVENYNPLYFLASGGEILLGHFARTLGEIYGGTLLDRLPGETQADRLQRLMLNVIATPDAVAARAFAIKPAKPIFTPAMKPVNQLPGSVISHPATGMTLHSVLQCEIDGQLWHLYPLGARRGVAVPESGGARVIHAATQNQHQRWQIKGLAGEHRFFHGKTPQWFINHDKEFYPVNYAAEEGVVTFSNGQTAWFHEASQQWKLRESGNTHLHSRTLAVLPEGVASIESGPHSVLASIGHEGCEVWSVVPDGEQFLKVIAGGEATYVPGRLEGLFFSIRAEQPQPIFRQTLLKWQLQARKWFRTDSPYSLLQTAEQHIDRSWLQLAPEPMASLVVVHNRPGLYRSGKHYFLRWQAQPDGAQQFLSLMPTADASGYRTPQPGAEYHNYFHFDEAASRWQFLPLTSEAFFGLPQSVKVQNIHPSAAMQELLQYRHLCFRGDDIFLHVGADSNGTPEFIQVEQADDDPDLFSLRVPGDDGPDYLWVFHADEDGKFTLEDKRLCQSRARRANEIDPCAGPSGINQPARQEEVEPVRKRLRPAKLAEYEMQLWLNGHPRSVHETIDARDTSASRMRKNLAYGIRLHIWAPKEMPVKYIAEHAGILLRRLNSLLFKLTPESCYTLVSNPIRVGETELNYALRLMHLVDGVSPNTIANFTGVKESKIYALLNPPVIENLDWVHLNPRHRHESNMQYALRLYHQPDGASRIAFIANYAGVNELALRLSVAEGFEQVEYWLKNSLRYSGESDMDYAIRLYQQPHEKVSIDMIATRAGVDKPVLLQKLGDLWQAKLQGLHEQQWLDKYPREGQESNYDYAVRLVKLRDEQVIAGTLKNKKIRNNIIALHAHLSPYTLATRLHDTKIALQWCNNHPRVPAEFLYAGEPAEVAEQKNKLYTLRLLKLRAGQPYNKIKNRVIAGFVGVTEAKLKIWIYQVKRDWFETIPRLPEETALEDENEWVIQQRNQLYARRLAQRRSDENMFWTINDPDICFQAEITIDSFRQALDPYFNVAPPHRVYMPTGELVWEPNSDLLHLRLKENAPLLTDPKDPDRSVTHEVITGPVYITNILNILKALPREQRQAVADSFVAQAQQLVESDGSRQDFFIDEQGNRQAGLLSQKLQIYYDEQNPQLGMQIIAKEDFEPYELIGVYTGTWHKNAESLREECRKMGSQSVNTYLWDVYKGEESVSAYQNANKLALINTAGLTKEAMVADKTENNLAVMYINGKLPAYYTIKKIAKGEPLMISYGDYYQPDYMIQVALNNDIFQVIAESKDCYFMIKSLDDKVAWLYGPQGILKEIPENTPYYILKERLDMRKIVRYDALYSKGGRKIAVSHNNENNLYHAVAKALHPRGGLDIINDEIKNLKQIVASYHAREQGEVKPEPETDDSAD